MRKITAKFNPELSERSDLAKIAFGNKKGNASEQRITLDLASDLYQIAADSRYLYSKDAIPKPQNPSHDGVSKYHYFLTNIVYKDSEGNYIKCHLNIDVKQNTNGNWFYSFGIEKGSAPQTLLAAVTDDSATLPNNNISNLDENVNNEGYKSSFNFIEPNVDNIEISDEVEFAVGLSGEQHTKVEKHILDICKKFDSNITVEFVGGLKTNGKFIRSQNKILMNSKLSAVQMYVEVFKHEFMHRLETKKLYGKFFDYCFKKSKAFEQYVRAELKTAGFDVDVLTREDVLEDYTEYMFNQYKNAEGIPQADRDAFTMENAQEEIIADFFAKVLFQGKQYRARIIEALQNADGEALIGIGDEVSSEAALLELNQKEPTLFEQVIEWIKDVINRLRGLPQAKSLVEKLDNEINLLESMARRAYQSKDSKRLMKKKLADVKYSFEGYEDDGKGRYKSNFPKGTPQKCKG